MSQTMQMYLSKEQLMQAQDKYHSNSILCEILAIAESLPVRLCFENSINYPYIFLFDKYDYGQIKYNNNSNIILKKLVAGIGNFIDSFKVYEEDHEKYNYPSNLNPKQICDYLNMWKKYVPKEIGKYYDNLINFFKNGKAINYHMGNNCKKEPLIKQDNLKDFADKFVNAQYMVNSGNKNVKDTFEKNGNYEFTAEIGQHCDNKLRNNIEHAKKVRKENNNIDIKE